MNRLAISFLGMATLASLAQAQTVSVEAAADTALWELDPDFNFGAQTELVAGSLGSFGDTARSRILLRFDVANALPAGAVLESADLRVTVVRTPPGASSSTFALHRVLRSWNEGAQSGDLPGGATGLAGEATWNTLWSEPGGELGEDFASEVSGTVRIDGNSAYVIDLNAQGLADVESMRSLPTMNHGWVLLTQSEETGKTARRFAAREGSTGVPSLTLNYEATVPFDVPLLESRLDVATKEVVIQVASQAGATYVLERALVEAPTAWSPVKEVISAETGPLEMRGETNDFDVVFYRITATSPL